MLACGRCSFWPRLSWLVELREGVRLGLFCLVHGWQWWHCKVNRCQATRGSDWTARRSLVWGLWTGVLCPVGLLDCCLVGSAGRASLSREVNLVRYLLIPFWTEWDFAVLPVLPSGAKDGAMLVSVKSVVICVLTISAGSCLRTHSMLLICVFGRTAATPLAV